MKKLLLCILATLPLSQAFSQKGFEVGIRGIPQNTWLLNGDESDPSSSISYMLTWKYALGLSAGYNFNSSFGLRSGVYYSVQGQKYEGSGGSGSDRETKLAYLKIPLLLKFSGEPSSTAFVTFYAGPQINLLMKAEHFVNGDLQSYPYNLKSAYNSSVISLVIGIGPDFSLSDYLKLNFNIHAEIGFKDVENKDFVYNGAPYWGTRPATISALGGLAIGVTYVFVKQDE